MVNQPVKLGWRDGELYVEVQPSTKQVDTMEETSKSPPPPEPIPLAEEADRILARAGDAAMRLDWPAIERALTDRQGYPIRITLPAPEEPHPSLFRPARSLARRSRRQRRRDEVGRRVRRP